MSRRAGGEPAGIAADAFYVLGMYAGDAGMTVAELHAAILREQVLLCGAPPVPRQVKGALATLARRRTPLAGLAARGRWRLTRAGHDMIAETCGTDDGGYQVRVPCGLGWPA